ncbi:sensor histidine kinase [Corynebacterium poyangense]|uniref:Sensor histidine kinase n=1 Tax=Corynebacterium poyangense TaxID=2684405 RepID=A0A7H0SRP4_9CORY|nr:sensor histidine kinase [Corynebacterium poyangense]MBZ8176652.1 sensor histidine kinase [Corynebacterium poyangense]QNQ91219.1 sensor histidine kinase [Corynebacterium poyangense]
MNPAVFHSSPLAQGLRWLRLVLHLMVALLLGVGVISSPHPTAALLLLTASSFGLCYVLGTGWERRFALGLSRKDFSRFATLWAAIILALWVLLVYLSPSFSWLLFPLVFILLQVFGTRLGLLAILASWGWITLGPHPATTAGAALGPGIGVVTAVGAFYIYRILLHETEELRRTRSQLLAAEKRAGQLAERERLSHEIHDTLAQGFSSIVLLSRAAHHSADPSEQLNTIHDVAQSNLAEARALVASLSQERMSLPQLLEQLVERTRRQEKALDNAVQIRFVVEGSGVEPSPKVSDALYRVAQEALANAVRYADAQRIQVALTYWPEQVALDIRDDGKGGAQEGAGFGISGMRARLNEVGGVLEVVSEAETGTIISAQVSTKEAA